MLANTRLSNSLSPRNGRIDAIMWTIDILELGTGV